MGAARENVDRWIRRLDQIDLAETDMLEAVVSQIPSELVRSVGNAGGPLIREKLLAPTFVAWERQGLVEWTGEVDPKGQRIWRKTGTEAVADRYDKQYAATNLTKPDKSRARSAIRALRIVRKRPG